MLSVTGRHSACGSRTDAPPFYKEIQWLEVDHQKQKAHESSES